MHAQLIVTVNFKVYQQVDVGTYEVVMSPFVQRRSLNNVPHEHDRITFMTKDGSTVDGYVNGMPRYELDSHVSVDVILSQSPDDLGITDLVRLR